MYVLWRMAGTEGGLRRVLLVQASCCNKRVDHRPVRRSPGCAPRPEQSEQRCGIAVAPLVNRASHVASCVFPCKGVGDPSGPVRFLLCLCSYEAVRCSRPFGFWNRGGALCAACLLLGVPAIGVCRRLAFHVWGDAHHRAVSWP